MKRLVALTLSLFFFTITLAGCSSDGVSNMELAVLSIGQADSIILINKNHTVLIDAGESEDGKKIVNYLKKKGISDVDCLIITHFDKDHVGGASVLINSLNIARVIEPSYNEKNDETAAYKKAIEERETQVSTLTEDVEFVCGDMRFNVYAPKESFDSDNDNSLVIKLMHGSNAFLFSGDAESARISELVNSYDLSCKLIKMPHHGIYDEALPSLLNACTPSYAIITDSQKNPADNETIELLNSMQIKTYCTATGNIYAVSNGSSLKLKRQ